MDSVSDATLRCGAEIVVHAYRDGNAPGLERVRQLGVEPVVFPATGTSEDVAMLLADDKGAELIVAVGTHATLVEFLDKGRCGHGQHLPDPAAGRRQARRRQGRQPALPLAHLQPVPWPSCCSSGSAPCSPLCGPRQVAAPSCRSLGARWDDFWSFVVGIFT